ncbi:secondary thiamine-phosphate synthase enzyme YjbQ [Salinirubrum litoreum]|uniref:Secondary thiamine-phosphate synthase enzyme YjbQ n=1 Tax=Salinirubrum litoreum TaxID=1126234 RepID=A0ABD5RBA1_9EURY|nr:secondary thiamine-phosphate synthase enzyme YjbQ [Salinirubrum litoreum]
MQFTVETDDRLTCVDVTDRVAATVDEMLPTTEKTPDAALCTVFVQHTTAGVIVQEPESRLLGDVETFLCDLVPDRDGYAHDEIDDNADSHLRATLLGESVSVPVREGELALGRWQLIQLVECDGPRRRTVEVVVTPAL